MAELTDGMRYEVDRVMMHAGDLSLAAEDREATVGEVLAMARTLSLHAELLVSDLERGARAIEVQERTDKGRAA